MDASANATKIALYMSRDFDRWLGQFSRHRGSSISATIEHGLRRAAAEAGFAPPPLRVLDKPDRRGLTKSA